MNTVKLFSPVVGSNLLQCKMISSDQSQLFSEVAFQIMVVAMTGAYLGP